MIFRKATLNDIDAIERIYNEIHDREEAGFTSIGWIREIYPTKDTAFAALERDDLFVCEDEGIVVASAIINRQQVPCYAEGKWLYEAADGEILVLHTLVVLPSESGRGIGPQFVKYYEHCALEQGLEHLRLDTNQINTAARAMYKKLGYREADVVPTEFNGIPEINLVLIEKKL